MPAASRFTGFFVTRVASRVLIPIDSNPTPSVWILATNSWNDNAKWVDTEFWQD